MFIATSLIISALLSYLLYAVNPINFSKKWQNIGVGFLRFLTFFILLFLLLEPMLKLKTKNIQKPVILIAADNSKSVLMNKDSIFYKTEYLNKLKNLSNKLSKNYQVDFYTFGSSLKNNDELFFNDLQTDISDVFNKALNDYTNLNLGAIILATDGIYNKGQNPEYMADALQLPVYTIALGDTNIYKDIVIKNVKYNDIVFENNSFVVAAEILHKKINKSLVNISVEHNGKTVATGNINASGESGFITLNFSILADNEGLQTYAVKAQQVEGEISYANNIHTFQVNVLKSKQKILIVGNTPHPDLTAIKQAVESNQNLSCEVLLAGNLNTAKLKQADMLILHQIPGLRNEGIDVLQFAIQQKIPLFFITGASTNYSSFNKYFTGINITPNASNTNNATANYNNGFNLFVTDESQYAMFSKFPPLLTPYASYKLPADAQVLFNQQIGYAKTNNPLLFFIKDDVNYTGFLLGEGFWRWRLHDFLLHNNHILSDELINKCIQLIAVKNDKSKFRIKPLKSTFYTTDNIEFEASFYNEANELTNTPEIEIDFKHETGKTYHYLFSKTNNAYYLNAGELPEGKYYFTANAMQHKKQGSFTILPQIAEFINTTANYGMLFNIANKTNGKFYYASNFESIINDIEENNNIKPIIYNNYKIKEILHLKWIFALVVFIISLEWFIRKYNGYI